MKKWLLLLLFVCEASLCVAQGVRYDLPPILSPRGLPLPNTSISLCPGTAVISGSTCGTTAQAFTDITLATPCTSGLPVTPPNLPAPQGVGVCSATGDSLGNAGFWLSPGAYIYCLNGPGITGKCYNLTVPVGSGSGGSAFSNAFTSTTLADRTVLINNPGFEQGAIAGLPTIIPPPGWANNTFNLAAANLTAGSTLTYETVSPAPGKAASLKMSTITQGAQLLNNVTFSVVPGETYSEQCQVKSDGNGIPNCNVTFRKSDGSAAGSDCIATGTTSTSWNSVSATCTVPANADWAFFRFSNISATQPSTIWLDTPTIQRTSFSGSLASPNINWKTPFDYGAKGDTIQVVDGNITSGAAILTTTTSTPFNCATDVGKSVSISGAGSVSMASLNGATGNNALVTTILSCQSTSQVTLNANAGATVTNTVVFFGTNDKAALLSCVQNGTIAGGKCTISDGKIFMDSDTASTLPIIGPGSINVNGGMVDGYGTIVFAPRGTITGGTNDRLFYLNSVRSPTGNPCQIAAGAINRGVTSVTVSTAGCVSTWVKGDYVVIHEKDSGFGDIVYIDFGTVSSISGTTVNLIAPVNVAFPNARTFNASGSPAPCVAASPCGLSIEKIGGIVSNVTIKDITIIVPMVSDGTNMGVGIVTTGTKNVTIQNLKCLNAAQNCTSHYIDVGLKYIGNSVSSMIQNEFAAQGGPTITGNVFNAPSVYNAMFNYSLPNGGGLNLDIGTGFAAVTNNTFVSPHQAGSPCFALSGGVHDSSVSNNTCGMINASNGITVNGGYNNALIANRLIGATGTSTGISIADTSTFNVNINSGPNFAVNSIDSSFTTPYSCAGTLNNDYCDDPVHGGTRAALTIKTTAVSFNFLTMNDTEPSGVLWDFGPQSVLTASFRRNAISGTNWDFNNNTLRVPSNWGYGFSSTTSATGGSDTGVGRGAAGIVTADTSVPGNGAGFYKAAEYQTTSNCSSSSGVCGSAASGSVSIAAAATTVTVATTAVNTNSNIVITENTANGTRLGVTCNTTAGRTYAVTTLTAGTSFVITTNSAPVTNPACLNFWIIN